MIEKHIFWLVAAIGLISCLLYGGKLMADDLARQKQCVELLVDEKIISIHAAAGLSQRHMVEKATRDTTVTDERWAKLLKLIDEAHKYEGGPGAWFANAWHACIDGV